MWSEYFSLQRGRGGNLAYLEEGHRNLRCSWMILLWPSVRSQYQAKNSRLKTEVLSSSTHTTEGELDRTSVLKYYQRSDCFKKLQNFRETFLVKYMFPLFNLNNKLVLKLIPPILNTVCGYSFAESISLFIATNLTLFTPITVECRIKCRIHILNHIYIYFTNNPIILCAIAVQPCYFQCYMA